MAEQRIVPIFIFAVTFMSTFFILTTLMPNDLYGPSEAKYQEAYLPSAFRTADLTQLAWYDNHTVPECYEYSNPVKFFLPPASSQIEVWAYWGDWQHQNELCFKHVWVTWYIVFGHYIEGLGHQGYGFSKQEILNAWDPKQNCSEIDSTCPCGTTYFIYISYNPAKYSNLSDAINHKEVDVLVGVGIKDATVKINAWNLVGQLLMFQAPGIPEPMNYLIALPMWACVGILVYILILMAIPFVG